ncbi:MAG: tetratricopeptide repeat protein [Gammaproteobacteria bacterium]|jgi:tetratricopeptide (TPR) repeat protein|nr:tetratricopeptide repeat protein [Gammaproteobacteria bacterium]MDH5173536.1 tetratricopeptide repeat protein [Gammaproteobacteria bacterium]
MMNASRVVRAMVFGLALALAGCASVGTSPTPTPPAVKHPPAPTPPPPVSAPQPPARPPQPSTSSAWQPLVQKAEQATARGDYEQALALLERAQRIDPESGEIYLQLARTQRAKGDAAQARATAERGMLFCSGSSQCNALRALTR